jgi:hypothetical protein
MVVEGNCCVQPPSKDFSPPRSEEVTQKTYSLDMEYGPEDYPRVTAIRGLDIYGKHLQAKDIVEIRSELAKMLAKSIANIDRDFKDKPFAASMTKDLQDLVDEYEDCFRPEPLAEDPAADYPPYVARLKEGATPVRCSPPRFNKQNSEYCHTLMTRLCKAGLMEKTGDSVWVSRPNLVPKPGADPPVRMTVDERAMNERLEGHVFPMPPIEDTVENTRGSPFYGKVDATHGY